MSDLRPVCLLTDFGTRDPYVGLMKSVIQSNSPFPPVIDLTHEVPPQDESAAAFLLEYCYPDLPDEAVVLLVVDPMVGTERNIVAVQTSEGRTIVAPDRGLVDGLSINRAVVVEDPPGRTDTTSSTFHGRDIFAPVARHLSLGGELVKLGTEIDYGGGEPLVPEPEIENGLISGRIVYIDHFGNLVTNIKENVLTEPDTINIQVGDETIRTFEDTYGKNEGLVGLISSFERLEIALPGGSAQKKLGVSTGDEVVVEIK